jgi:hypothetical protein
VPPAVEPPALLHFSCHRTSRQNFVAHSAWRRSTTPTIVQRAEPKISLSLSLSLALSLSLSSCLLFAQDNSCKVHAHFFKPSRGSAQDTHTAGGVRPACFQQRQIASLCCLYPISPIHFRGQKRATLGGSSLKKKFTKKKYLTASSPRMGPVSNEALRKRFDVAADCVRGEARSAM